MAKEQIYLCLYLEAIILYIACKILPEVQFFLKLFCSNSLIRHFLQLTPYDNTCTHPQTSKNEYLKSGVIS